MFHLSLGSVKTVECMGCKSRSKVLSLCDYRLMMVDELQSKTELALIIK